MEVEEAYLGVSRFMDAWVRLMESHTRSLELRDSKLSDAKILIISAPTDSGIITLTRANRQGESYLLCFSAAIERIAQDYCKRHRVQNLRTVVAPFFHVPFADEELDAIYANCFFDFCETRDLDAVVDELWRALRNRGSLYATYLGKASSFIGRSWIRFFRRFPGLSYGIHPVDVTPWLRRRGFGIVTDRPVVRLGCPLRYLQAEKPSI
jgi:ubiquinone/menaquinone biosynthesis C-methylase UbiE